MEVFYRTSSDGLRPSSGLARPVARRSASSSCQLPVNIPSLGEGKDHNQIQFRRTRPVQSAGVAGYTERVDVHVSLLGRKDLSGEIYRQLRRAILEGRLRPGEFLPPTRELAQRLNVARMTVTVAYDRLVAEGFVSSRVGSGTFVSEHAAPPVGNRQDVSLTARSGPGPSGIQSHCPRPSLALLNSIFGPAFRTHRFFPMTSGGGWFLRRCDRTRWAQASTANRQDICPFAKRLPGTSESPAVWKSRRKISRL